MRTLAVRAAVVLALPALLAAPTTAAAASPHPDRRLAPPLVAAVRAVQGAGATDSRHAASVRRSVDGVGASWTTIGSLTDPSNPGAQAFSDILAARVEQEGGLLRFVIEVRGNIPSSLPLPDDSITYLWLVDADRNAATGQPHGALGSEFNVRAVVSEVSGGGWVDVTGSLPGGGPGSVSVAGSQVTI
ncbi:MAG TPA: hypothetical protein PLV66_09730, partial [Thermoanaerobaculales bacterium]|nr:hypothetical protein [Thermoanaerobaculales bacterium]